MIIDVPVTGQLGVVAVGGVGGKPRETKGNQRKPKGNQGGKSKGNQREPTFFGLFTFFVNVACLVKPQAFPKILYSQLEESFPQGLGKEMIWHHPYSWGVFKGIFGTFSVGAPGCRSGSFRFLGCDMPSHISTYL